MKLLYYLLLVFISAVVVVIWMLDNFFIISQPLITQRTLLQNKRSEVYLITVIYGGGLGNNIWEYMSLLAILRKYENAYNLIPYIPQELKDSMTQLFETVNILEIESLPSYCPNNNSLRVVRLNETFNANNVFKNDHCIVLEMYSAKYEDVLEYGIKNIKNELRFQQRHIKSAYNTLYMIKNIFKMNYSGVIYVGVHYRGTDYLRLLQHNYDMYNDPPNYKYYSKIMNYFKNKFKNVIFILITVDSEWLQENLPFLQNRYNIVVNPNGNDTIKDLVLLSYCNHSIINYGTYGTTSALFSGGTTFAYDLGLPLDHRGPTVAAGIAGMLPQWHLLT